MKTSTKSLIAGLIASLAVTASASTASADCLAKYRDRSKAYGDWLGSYSEAGKLGQMVSGRNDSVAAATITSLAFTLASEGPREKERQEIISMIEAAVDPTRDRFGEDAAFGKQAALATAPLVRNDRFLRHQRPLANLNALRRGNLNESFCRGNKLASLAEIREIIRQEVVSSPEHFRSRQSVSMRDDLKRIEDKLLAVEMSEAARHRPGSAR